MQISPRVQRGPHMLGLKLPAKALKRAREQMKKFNIYVGIRSDSMRISPHLHTNENDIDRLIEALKAIGR